MLNIHRIKYLYDTEGTNSSAKAVGQREKHIIGLHTAMKRQRIETNRRDYRLQELNNYGKMLFYAYLQGSKSLLVHMPRITNWGIF